MSIDWKRMHEDVKRAEAVLDAALKEIADEHVDDEPSEAVSAVMMDLALGSERAGLAAMRLERLVDSEPAFKRNTE